MNDVHLTGQEELLRNQQASLQNLEHQVVQITKTLAEHPQGLLPSNTKVNPWESRKAVTLRNDKDLSSSTVQEAEKEPTLHKEIEIEDKPLDLDVKETKKEKIKESLVYLLVR